MRVLHVSSALSWRGGEQQVAWLLEELRTAGVEQQVYCPTGTPLATYAEEKQYAWTGYQKTSSLSVAAARGLKRAADDYQADIIHLHDSHAHTYAVMAATFFSLKTPLVLSRRVDFPIAKSWASKWKYNHSSIKKIICVSDFIQELIRPQINDPKKITTVHSGVDLTRFSNQKNGKLHSLIGLPRDTVLIGKVAAIAPHKDFFTFVDTCVLINQQKPEVEFVIIGGDGGEEALIRTYIEEKKLDDKIHLVGFQNNVPDLLQDLTLFLFTSKTEGLGTSLLDAAAAGIPIVATRAGGIPEIISDGENGRLAAVGDAEALAGAAVEILQDEALQKRYSKRGLELVKRFDKKETARKILAVYDFVKS